jgi:ankyrin repeat protein
LIAIVARGAGEALLDVKARGRHGWPRLIEAAVDGDLELVLRMLENGAALAATDSDGKTALSWAAMRGRTEVVRLLLDSGADANHADSFGDWTPLMLAAGHAPRDRATETMALLIERGAEVDARSRWGTTALHSAAVRGAEALVRFLLEHGAAIDSRSDSGRTTLIQVARMGFRSDEMVRTLLAPGGLRGADVDAQDGEGMTALMWASVYARLSMMRTLLDAGAAIDLQDAQGRTALFRAAGPAPPDSAIGVLCRRSDAHEGKISEKNRLLLEREWSRRAEAVRVLLDRNAEAGIRDRQGRTALDWAERQPGGEAVVAVLRHFGEQS